MAARNPEDEITLPGFQAAVFSWFIYGRVRRAKRKGGLLAVYYLQKRAKLDEL